MAQNELMDYLQVRDAVTQHMLALATYSALGLVSRVTPV
jgi:hypothetical protein